MKNKRFLTMMLIACLVLLFSSCAENGQAPEPDPAEMSAETTMENFVNKLNAGNYVIDAEGNLKTVAVSPGQVYFTYGEDSSADSFAFVTLKGETFEGMMDDEALNDVIFVSADNAIDSLGTLLPNSWMTISEGNMFNLFYNNVDDPLEFSSHDESVKRTLLSLGGYGENALNKMEDVYMHLDAADPTSVHFSAVIQDDPVARIFYDDLDLTIQFGVAESDPRIEKWLSSPTYPPTRTSWTEDDMYTLDNVFLRGYGTDAVPFPSFASYAMNFDQNAYAESLGIRVTDAHGTEENLEEYKAQLLNSGYSEATETLPNGSTATVYRRLLREDYRAYAQLYPYYDDGFVLEGHLYHEDPVYDGLPAINEVLLKNGFAEFEDTDVFKEWTATDSATSRSEGWAYFFDYDLYMPFILSFDDRDSAKAYLENYGSKLLGKGFARAFTPGEDNGMYESANGFVSFKYTFNEDNTVTLEFKNEKSLTAEEAKALITEHGIPQPDLFGAVGSRDLTRYRYEIGQFKGLFLQVFQPFESTEAAESFLDAYIPILEENGYIIFDPQKLGSQKPFLYFNEDVAKYVAFDFLPDGTAASVNFDFVSIEPEDDSIMLNAIRY